jgi:hypothetical protein
MGGTEQNWTYQDLEIVCWRITTQRYYPAVLLYVLLNVWGFYGQRIDSNHQKTGRKSRLFAEFQKSLI